MIYSNMKPPKYNGEELSENKRMVETLGHIPAKERIQNLVESGVKLAAYRMSQYDADYAADPSKIPEDIFRDRGLTEMDVLERARATANYYNRLKERAMEARDENEKLKNGVGDKGDKTGQEMVAETTQKSDSGDTRKPADTN